MCHCRFRELQGACSRLPVGRLEYVGPEGLEGVFARLVNNHCLRANDEFAVAARSEAPDRDLEVEISYLSGQVLPALEGVLERYGFAIPSWGSAMTIYERLLP